MDFELTSEHLMLKESAASFIKKDHSFDRIRELKNDPLGFSKDLWKKMADLGWMGFIFPEEYGGLELDYGYVMVLLEELGKGLLPEPWISSVLLGGNLILSGGTDSQKKEILPKIISGDLFVTAAYLEDNGRYDLNYCSTSATKKDGKFSISGKKIFVLDGCSADKIIVSVRTSGSTSDNDGITLLLIPKNANGITKTPIKTMDGRKTCMLELKDVSASEDDIIGNPDDGYSLLSDAVDKAAAGLCAEMIGGMNTSIDLTVSYLSEREQFGKAIGTFQSLQHKAADMLIQKELATSALYYAIASIDSNSKDTPSAISIAKAKCSSAFMEITKIAIQLFGAYGFTNESDISLFIKRAKVCEILFGDVNYYLDRLASLKGY